MKTKILNLIFPVFFVLYISCSVDENAQNCLETSVTMVVNGEMQTFEANAYGVDLNGNQGYTLQINLYRGSNNPFREQGIVILLPYKKTGENVIKNFNYHQYINGVAFNGDFINGEFQSKVITNSNSCFYATFSGKLNDGNQEVIITDGKVSYQYETPFDD